MSPDGGAIGSPGGLRLYAKTIIYMWRHIVRHQQQHITAIDRICMCGDLENDLLHIASTIVAVRLAPDDSPPTKCLIDDGGGVYSSTTRHTHKSFRTVD